MSIFLQQSAIYVHPPLPIEFPGTVDGKAIRVAIEWPAVVEMMGGDPKSEDAVREFIREHKSAIEISVHASLAARGSPIGGLLVLAADDLWLLRAAGQGRTARASSAPGFAAGTRH